MTSLHPTRAPAKSAVKGLSSLSNAHSQEQEGGGLKTELPHPGTPVRSDP